ncbi:hypothetical protein DM793_02325 [Paenarthrobacter nitroguajacolicus]|nr:hypothetical protein [Paenarthrobacter nitroguajacolicus]
MGPGVGSGTGGGPGSGSGTGSGVGPGSRVGSGCDGSDGNPLMIRRSAGGRSVAAEGSPER